MFATHLTKESFENESETSRFHGIGVFPCGVHLKGCGQSGRPRILARERAQLGFPRGRAHARAETSTHSGA